MNNFLEVFNTQINSGHFSISMLLISFFGGVLISLTPCNLAMLPLVIGYVLGREKQNTAITTLQLIVFFLGFSFIFSIIGIIAALTGNIFGAMNNSYWMLFVASLILFFGLIMIGVLDFNFPVLMKKVPEPLQNHKFLYAFILGMFFAMAATPCATPVLAGIMALTTLSGNIIMGALMLFLFSLGQSVVIILAGLLTSFLKNLRKIDFITKYTTLVAGWIFIVCAAILYIKIFKPLF